MQRFVIGARGRANARSIHMRIPAIIIGVVLAALGGVIAYRAAFLEPNAAVVVTDRDVREVPDMLRIVGGVALLLAGAAIAFFAARRTRS